ncbi:MAG: hypothetical protein Q7Q71_11725 [Verrucomicrobiota bacterium JB023]|nr:hypothetical protein [Verrucomicrobiota bacterium JB023]
MLVLLALLAVALLSLSSTTLRSASHDKASAVARANARMALMMALGELQKNAGLDTRVTAKADIIDTNVVHRHLTGVWDGWEIDPQEPPSSNDYEPGTKERRHFRSWLVSGAQGEEERSYQFAKSQFDEPITLWGTGTLGTNVNEAEHVTAPKVELAEGTGAMAWAVMDEGVKARINTQYQEAAEEVGDQLAQLGSGKRPATEMIPGLEDIERRSFEWESSQSKNLSKGITHSNFELVANRLGVADTDQLKAIYHDVSIHSQGLLTNTARGGLRKDFSLLTNAETLPTEFNGTGVYQTTFDFGPSDYPSDPKWGLLHDFSRLYLDNITEDDDVPVLRATAPVDKGWEAATVSTRRGTTTINRDAPPGPVLMPTIAKVQMIFSLIGRDIYNHSYFPPGPAPIRVNSKNSILHNPQGGHFRETRYDYDLHLLYTPVVTLHNPYNVALEFDQLRVEFQHVPFAMQIFRNDVPQSQGLVPLETMYRDYSPSTDKVFGMDLKTKRRERPSSATFRMLPGETILFSPYIDPNRTFATDLKDRQFWDIYVGTGITDAIDAIPGWRGDGIGFDCDWLAGAQAIDGVAENGRWASCYGLAGDDQIHVEFAPISTTNADSKFTIKMQAVTPGSTQQETVSAIEIDYEQLRGLQDTILGSNETLRFPSVGYVQGNELVDHATRKIQDIINVKPFAVLSCQAKTTFGGLDAGSGMDQNLDGRLATKPWSFAHGVIGSTSAKILSEHPSNHSHELDLQLLDLGEGTISTIGVDGYDRANFITGHTPDRGQKFGVHYEVPIAPLQSLASLNGANPGGSSGYLPRFAQPIGNSWAHPMLNSQGIIQNGSDGNPLVDHSFLLNLALYDDFYFSGLADRTGDFGSGIDARTLAEDFIAGEPLDDPRLVFHQRDDQASSEFIDLVENADELESIKAVASWQHMLGAFNINSTSVPAWKAMLASVHDPNSIVNLVNPSSSQSEIEALSPIASNEARISRFRLPLTPSEEDGGPAGISYWVGPREYTEADLEKLAIAIVEEVRSRGPFLSLGEFVNRQLGSGEMAQRGALQQAIDDSGLNEEIAQFSDAGYEIAVNDIADYNYENPAAGAGSSYQGAPGYLSQADLMTVLGNAATARSDTFTIRGYGESRSRSGQILATATCEAVVQRQLEWLDPRDDIETELDDLQSETNREFGRRFQIVSFRWLNAEEV